MSDKEHGHTLSDEQAKNQLTIIGNYRAQTVAHALLPILLSPACVLCQYSMAQAYLEQLIGSFIAIVQSRGIDVNIDELLDEMKEGINEFVIDINKEVDAMNALRNANLH